jgi:hypothetical protein
MMEGDGRRQAGFRHFFRHSGNPEGVASRQRVRMPGLNILKAAASAILTTIHRRLQDLNDRPGPSGRRRVRIVFTHHTQSGVWGSIERGTPTRQSRRGDR